MLSLTVQVFSEGKVDKEGKMYQIYGDGKTGLWVVSTQCNIKKIHSILELVVQLELV